MKLIQSIKELPVNTRVGIRYHGIAFDGCEFILTATHCSKSYIFRFNSRMEPICGKEVCRGYTAICYDPCLCCFWAATECGGRKLYQLDTEFNDVDFLALNTHGKFCGALTGVALGSSQGTLVVSFADGAAEVCKSDGELISTLPTKDASIISGILGCSDFFGAIYQKSNCSFIGLQWYDGLSQVKLCLEEDCFPIDMTCCQRSPREAYIYLLSNRKSCYPCVIILKVVDGDCSDEGEHHYCPGICPPPPHPPHPPCPPKPIPGRACEDLLESIALVEAGLSHILNAEGEKIQKAVAMSCDIDELLAINDSVTKTVRHATYLEQLLVNKLELVQDICDCKKPKPPRPPKPPKC